MTTTLIVTPEAAVPLEKRPYRARWYSPASPPGIDWSNVRWYNPLSWLGEYVPGREYYQTSDLTIAWEPVEENKP